MPKNKKIRILTHTMSKNNDRWEPLKRNVFLFLLLIVDKMNYLCQDIEH